MQDPFQPVVGKFRQSSISYTEIATNKALRDITFMEAEQFFLGKSARQGGVNSSIQKSKIPEFLPSLCEIMHT